MRINLEKLKKIQVNLENTDLSFSLFECLSKEIELNKRKFILGKQIKFLVDTPEQVIFLFLNRSLFNRIDLLYSRFGHQLKKENS